MIPLRIPYSAIDEAIHYIQQHLCEPLPLERMAAHVAYSPFHFARLFRERTGLSPHYYVSSYRLQRAKALLLQTDLTVRDVAWEIGQKSLGTFTTRFAERVGATPADFRNSRLKVHDHLTELQSLRQWPAIAAPGAHGTTVQGTIGSERPFTGVILIGLFPRPIPEGLPTYGTLLPGVGRFCFPNVKPGTYYLMATVVPWGMHAAGVLVPNEALRARLLEPIVVTPASSVPNLHVMLHAPLPEDPPILISLPLLMRRFLNRAAQNSNLTPP